MLLGSLSNPVSAADRGFLLIDFTDGDVLLMLWNGDGGGGGGGGGDIVLMGGMVAGRAIWGWSWRGCRGKVM